MASGRNGPQRKLLGQILMEIAGVSEQDVQKALRLIDQREMPEPSYWRCLEVSPEEFREDCRLIDRLIDGEPLQPLFLAGPSRPEPGEPNTA